MSLLPAPPFLRTGSASQAVGGGGGGGGAAQGCRAHLLTCAAATPSSSRAPAAAGKGSDELLPPTPTHSQGTKHIPLKWILNSGLGHAPQAQEELGAGGCKFFPISCQES